MVNIERDTSSAQVKMFPDKRVVGTLRPQTSQGLLDLSRIRIRET